LASFCTSSAPCASLPPTNFSPSDRDVRTWFLAASIVLPRFLRISERCSAVGLLRQSSSAILSKGGQACIGI
jgi:hypothetical protein